MIPKALRQCYTSFEKPISYNALSKLFNNQSQGKFAQKWFAQPMETNQTIKILEFQTRQQQLIKFSDVLSEVPPQALQKEKQVNIEEQLVQTIFENDIQSEKHLIQYLKQSKLFKVLALYLNNQEKYKNWIKKNIPTQPPIQKYQKAQEITTQIEYDEIKLKKSITRAENQLKKLLK